MDRILGRAAGRHAALKRLIIAFPALVVLTVLSFFALSAYQSVQELQRGVQQLEQARAVMATTSSQWTPSRLATAKGFQRKADLEISAASARLRQNPLVRASGSIPGLQDQTQAMLDLVAASGDASVATDDLLQVMDRYQRARTAPGPSAPKLVELLSASRLASVDAERRLNSAIRRLDSDLQHPLLPPLAKQVRASRQRLQAAHEPLLFLSAASAYLPAALGNEGSKTYLLLFTNPSELRPAGGFVGTFASMTVVNGVPISLDVKGEQELDELYRTKYPIPRSLGDRLSFPNGSLDIGDAGWDPDFPSSAMLSEEMYHSATGKTVDGTIAVDPYAIAALLRITGPVEVPPYGQFTADNFFSKLNLIVNVQKDPDSGKKAVGPVAHAVLDRMLAAPPDKWMDVLTSSRDQAQARHLQFFLHDPALATAARAAHYDGAVVPVADGEDYLMVVDANIGGTKGDFYIGKQMQGMVEVTPQGLARHEVVLRYKFPAGVEDPSVAKNRDPAYRDYVRFYLPETSTVLAYYEVGPDGQKQGAVEEQLVAHGKRVVGVFFRLAPGQSTELHLLFQTPVGSDGRYRLYVQKQAGVPARPLELAISYPGGLLRRRLAGERDEEARVSW